MIHEDQSILGKESLIIQSQGIMHLRGNKSKKSSCREGSFTRHSSNAGIDFSKGSKRSGDVFGL